MKRKSIILVLIAVLLLIGLAIYFRPLRFSVPDEISQISIVLNEYAVSDGKPTIDSAEYPATGTEQISALQIPPRGRLQGESAQDDQRQDPAQSAVKNQPGEEIAPRRVFLRFISG